MITTEPETPATMPNPPRTWKVFRDGVGIARIIEVEPGRIVKSHLLWGPVLEHQPRLHDSYDAALDRFIQWEARTPAAPPPKLLARKTKPGFYGIYADGQKIGTLDRSVKFRGPADQQGNRWLARITYQGDSLGDGGRVYDDLDTALREIRGWVNSRSWWKTLASS